MPRVSKGIVRRALLRNNKSEQKMEKDKKDKTPRQLGKAAAEARGSEEPTHRIPIIRGCSGGFLRDP